MSSRARENRDLVILCKRVNEASPRLLDGHLLTFTLRSSCCILAAQKKAKYRESLVVHASYDPKYANRFWRTLVQTDSVMKAFRSRFIGKSSPVHFFWGSFDLAVTRFSGRRAPERPGADLITREAYSHEVISCGFWPGDATFQAPAFYSYTAPEPPGLSAASLRPGSAWYSPDKGLFLLSYDDVRNSSEPEKKLMDFLQSTYEAGANLAHWDDLDLLRGEVDR